MTEQSPKIISEKSSRCVEIFQAYTINPVWTIKNIFFCQMGYRSGVCAPYNDLNFLQSTEQPAEVPKDRVEKLYFFMQDLVAASRSYEVKPWAKAYKQTKKATNPIAMKETDFRNVGFLHRFTSEAGNLPSQKVTRLQKKIHRHVMRSIKASFSSSPHNQQREAKNQRGIPMIE